MPAPGTPKQRLTKAAEHARSGNKSPKSHNPKPARAPKPPKNKSTPSRKPDSAPFDVRSIVSKLNKRNIEDQLSDTSENEPESTTIEVNDDLNSKDSNLMDTDEILKEQPQMLTEYKPLPNLQIPDSVRQAVGPNWRLKEAILNSYHFGRPSIRPIDFARSKIDTKTADIISNSQFSNDAKKHAVKLFLGKTKILKIPKQY